MHQDAAVGAEVTIDEEQLTTIKTGNGRQTVRVAASEKERLLKVTKEGFESFTERFVLKEGGQTVVEVWLEPKEISVTEQPEPVPDAGDRALTQWVMSKGGVVQADLPDGRRVVIRTNDDLPRADVPLRVAVVDFTEVSSLSDEDVAELPALWSRCHQSLLYHLNLQDTGITDAAADALAGMQIRILCLFGTATTDAGVAKLANINGLGAVYLGHTAVTDATCQTLSAVDGLTFIELSWTHVTDRGAAHLAKLPKLAELQIIGNDGIGDDTLRWACEHPTLQTVRLGGTRVTDAGLEAVVGSGLKELEVNGCAGVTDRGLESLSQEKTIVHLNLSGLRSISDAGVAHLGSLPEMRLLDVHATLITDGCLETLQQFKKLSLLRIYQTEITPEGVQRLNEALPDCEIVWDGGTIKPAGSETDATAGAPGRGWQPGPADDVLPGIVPRPAALAGVNRWQVETITPRNGVSSAAYSPDGKILACGTYAGQVRLFDADTLELLALYPGSHSAGDLSWSPDGRIWPCATLATSKLSVARPCSSGRFPSAFTSRSPGILRGGISPWGETIARFTSTPGIMPRLRSSRKGLLQPLSSNWPGAPMENGSPPAGLRASSSS